LFDAAMIQRLGVIGLRERGDEQVAARLEAEYGRKG